MANRYGPRIVTDGLSLCLDAGNSKSYPGTGSVWTDLAQNIKFSSYGTQTPHATIQNVGCFEFNDSGYWQSDSGHELVDMGGDCTLLMWLYFEEISERDTIFEKAGTSYQSYQQEIAVTWETTESFSYFSRRVSNYDVGSIISNNLSKNQWHLISLKMSTGKTATARTGFYSTNGAPWVSNYTSRSTEALTPAGPIRIGTGYAGPVESGKIAMVICYNKMLSDEEIKQNYDALKGRFGL